jgi:FkbM family methyltransferase
LLDHIDRMILVEGWYELQALNDMSQYSGVFVDCGANIGNHSKFMAEHGFKVYSFEPSDRNFNRLKKVKGIKRFKCGLGNREMTGWMLVRNKFNRGEDTLLAGAAGVHIKTLDSFHLKPDVLKIDVEGMELDVLEGAEETLKCFPVIYVEIIDNDEIAVFLGKRGYSLEGVFHDTLFKFVHHVV